ncbi:protein TolA [Bradyrhizobium lablabi]|uniref:protein TolA n=1 Tax=Bradyrhizobium lablabi TaxID=722472 RepID=UPI001BADB090|nr:protein TolA [Bradyrhizobium lablabi]MBR0697969.1 protein TolA [Bradyrhizobium lablabi]
MATGTGKPDLKVKVDKTLAASIVLHVLVIGWGLVSFSTKAFVMPEEDTVAVDVISPDQLSHVMAGQKDGKKENPKPLVEKVAEAKPVDDAVGKIEDKKPPVVTDTAPPPTPKVEEKPEEKKPDPPKKAENKPKEEPKPVEKKPDPVKPDEIAEAIKKEEKKPPPKPPVQQAAKPPEQKPKERVFDQSKIAALLDKRDPTRAAATGETLNSNAALGTSKGKAADNSATWGTMFKQQVERCWKKPYGGIEAQQTEAAFTIRLKRDGTLEGMPVPESTPPTPYLRVYQESALRAIIECQPYNLPAAWFDEWKYFAPVFTERKT